ncbi:MAG TPA: ABC transporter substrate-binding protein [Anaerolineales bacterium]|nr:ABC transporter substrate-binding protein [Anaerolineales bacterium]
MRKLSILLILLTFLTACGSPATLEPTALPPTLEPEILTHVKLAMGYIPDIQFAPFYLAAEKGYFAENGIEIEFDHSLFEDKSVPLLGVNELQFANVSAEQIIQARAQGLPVVYVMKWWEKYPIAVVSKADTGIKSPADLAGRKVGIPGLYGASYIGWQALLNSQNLPADTAQLEAIGFTQAEALVAGTIDAAIVYANNEPVKLAAAGEQLNVIAVADYAQLASNGLATNETTMNERPELVDAMVRAILKGLADTIANPAEAVQVSMTYIDPPPEAVTARSVLDASIEMWKTSSPGASDLARWQTTHDTLLKMGLIAQPVNLEEAFTNIFIPAQ